MFYHLNLMLIKCIDDSRTTSTTLQLETSIVKVITNELQIYTKHTLQA